MTARPESPYEAAARVADNWATRALIPECLFFAEQIAREIRALPHPPERVLPVFTGKEIFEHSVGTGLSWSQRIADYINTRIAGSGFAQSGQGEQLIGWLYFNEDSGVEFSEQHPIESGEVPDASCIVSATPKHLLDHLKEAWSRIQGLQKQLYDDSAIQARIDAAVLAEREAIIASMREEILRCHAAIEAGSQRPNHRQSIFQLECEIGKIRARTTNTEIAADGATGHDDSPSGTTSLPVTEGDAGRALSTRQIIIEQQGDAIYARSYDGRRTLIGFLK
jgi:hypothetical protein